MWKKVFSHDATGGPFPSAEATKMSNPLDETAKLFSMMDKLPQYKVGNKWHFKLCYPELDSQYSFPCNEWTQTSKPHDGFARSVQLWNTTFVKKTKKYNFNGLHKTKYGDKYGGDLSVLKSTPGNAERWFTVGALVLEEGKIPGPLDTLVNKVELYVKRENRLAAGTGRKKREATRLVKREAESEEQLAQRSYGSRLRYECGAARKFLEPDSEELYSERWLECHWNKTWGPVDSLDQCSWVQCLYPPDPPIENAIMVDWDQQPVEFYGNVSYKCKTEDTFFLWDNTMEEFNVTCLPGGEWELPLEWPVCVDCK